jgi:hypothetical protein
MTKPDTKFKGTFHAPLPLPRIPEVFDKKEREEYSIPGDKEACKIECQIRKINGSEMLHEGIKFFQDLKYIKEGCNIKQPIGIHKIAMQLLIGPARSTYVEIVDKAYTTDFAMKQLPNSYPIIRIPMGAKISPMELA